jgi:hypothetical protein
MRRYGWVVWIGVMGCDDVIFGQSNDGVDDVPSQDGYAGVVELATDHCYTCHSEAANTSAGFGLNLETDLHANTVAVVGSYGLTLVTPDSPDDSMLYLKITGTNPDNTGGGMPPGGSLSTGATDVVRAWIEDGAPAE